MMFYFYFYFLCGFVFIYLELVFKGLLKGKNETKLEHLEEEANN